MVNEILETSITIMAVSLILFGALWVFKRIFTNEVVVLPDNGYLILVPGKKPKYSFSYVALYYYKKRLMEAGIPFRIYHINNGNITIHEG